MCSIFASFDICFCGKERNSCEIREWKNSEIPIKESSEAMMKRRGKYLGVRSTSVGRAVIASQRKAPMNSRFLSVLSFRCAHVLSR